MVDDLGSLLRGSNENRYIGMPTNPCEPGVAEVHNARNCFAKTVARWNSYDRGVNQLADSANDRRDQEGIRDLQHG